METQKPLTETDKRNAFLAAVGSYQRSNERWLERQQTGLTDKQLEDALKYELGIFGGSSARDNCPSITYQGAGLKIWAGWRTVNHCLEKPIFEGRQTIALARELFAIPNPDDDQLSMF
ncbi:MAG: hypothetical protein DHS20C05_13310 [Hyphococcus sp.]|nr:MAG: hypothetical protein DHS20C05_13310 [Marinicaulis sp.]